MSSRPVNYSKLTRAQVDILEKYFENGMKSTMCSQQIEKAAEQTSLPVEKIKKWIGNKTASQRKKLMQVNSEEPPNCSPPKVPKPPTGLRGSSAYNLFCSDFFKSDEVNGISNLAEKNKKASEKWKDLAESTKNKWVEEAAGRKKLPSNLDMETKQKLVDQHIKLVAKELNYLESLGCGSSCLLVDLEKQVFVLGSREGKNLLHDEPAIIHKFQSRFDVPDTVYTHEHVGQLFNTKYSEAKGVVGARVPYLAGGFHVEGLPENIKLKKPRHYGANEIKKIMSQKESIRFVIDEKSEEQAISVLSEDAEQLLMNIFGTNIFVTRKITMEDVQKLDKEKLSNVSVIEDLMVVCKDLFMEEAIAELKEKLTEVINNANGLILPIYCEDEQDSFWLFYFPGGASYIQTKGPKDQLQGYWLDHEESYYKLLKEKVTILNENIIKDDGNLIFVVHNFSDKSENFKIDEMSKKKIIDALSRQGFM